MRRERGITLVALVITIIVLIILAAVSIRAVLNDGIIINAKGAKENWEAGRTDEEGKLNYLLGKIEGKESENGSITIEKTSGEKLTNYRIYGNSVQCKLPSEYQEVEYIEITGTQYIDTNFTPSGKLTVKGKINVPKPNREIAVIGTENFGGWELGFSTVENRMFSYIDKPEILSLAVITTSSLWDNELEFTAINDYDNSFRSLSVNVDDTYSSDTKVSEQYRRNLLLFNYRKAYGFTGKCYNFKIYNDDVLVRDFVPCYRKSDNEIGMYDLVENKFYTNAGTGEFIKGNNVTPTPTPEAPIEIKNVGDYDEATGKYKIPIKVNEETTNIYLDEPLRKIGDYADYIDFEKQKVVRQVYKHLFTGGENWFEYSNGTTAMSNLSQVGLRTNYEELSNRFKDYGTSIALSMSLTNKETNRIGIDQYKTIPGVTDINTLKTWLVNNETYFMYHLKTPIEETIDLPEIKTAKGTTNITIDTVTTPSKIEVDY